jgi:hypothetical protein
MSLGFPLWIGNSDLSCTKSIHLICLKFIELHTHGCAGFPAVVVRCLRMPQLCVLFVCLSRCFMPDQMCLSSVIAECRASTITAVCKLKFWDKCIFFVCVLSLCGLNVTVILDFVDSVEIIQTCLHHLAWGRNRFYPSWYRYSQLLDLLTGSAVFKSFLPLYLVMETDPISKTFCRNLRQLAMSKLIIVFVCNV